MAINTSVGIIGGGFAGTTVAANLVSNATKPIDIYLIESSDQLSGGVAFSTKNPQHPLNVRACNMSALAHEPNDFFQWLESNQESWRKTDPNFLNLAFTPQSYLPRKLYGLYLKDLLLKTQNTAQKKGIRFSIIQKEAVDVLTAGNKLTIVLKEHPSINCDFIVLAAGITPIKSLPFETSTLLKDPRYVPNIWHPRPNSIIKMNLQTSIHDHWTTLIIGSGLTMVDAIISLMSQGYSGKIIAFSSSGALPEVHTKSLPVSNPILSIHLKSKSLLNLFKEFRAEIKKASRAAYDWRLVIDAIRPAIPKLWKQLSIDDKKRFLRHVLPLWNKHRHRMSPDSKKLLNFLERSHRLELRAGIILGIDASHPEVMRIQTRLQGSNIEQVLEAHHVINCTGPEYKMEKQKNHLLHKLHEKKMICWDNLGMGLAIASNGSVKGCPPDKIYALGSLLFGECFETIAVPEIRQQAVDIANNILKSL